MSKAKGKRQKAKGACFRLRRQGALWGFFLFPFSLLLFPFSFARAALDPEIDKPYRLRVVLRIADNRLLTPVFRERLQRELQDSLQDALGDLAQVQIVHRHPLLKEIETRGLQAALDNYSALSDTKTHFVLIDFLNGRYELQTRQHDGFTGLPSPVVRRSSTADRQLVARLAALLIDQDFGLTGTLDMERIEMGKTDSSVAVRLKGGGLGAPLDHWLQKDQVFAVSQIPQGGGSQRSIRMNWTLLQVLEEPHGAVCHCRLLSRWKEPLPRAADVLGYRCLKLGTTRAPLRLRIVKDDKLKTPIPGVQVMIGPRSFEGTSGFEAATTKSDGLVRSQNPYENVAFVRIYDGPVPLARAPAVILDGVTITCPVSLNPQLAEQGELLDRRKRWLLRLSARMEVAVYLTRDLNAMSAAGQSSESRLTRAQQGLGALQSAVSILSTERDALRAASSGKPSQALDLKEGEARLQALQSRCADLERYIGLLQENITREKDPRRRQWQDMAAQADLLEREADFGKAIELYEKALELYRQIEKSGDNAELRRRLDGLKQAWATKSQAHAKARDFIYRVWPTQQTAAQMKAGLEEARRAFQVCKDAGDTLTPRKLLKTFVDHTARLDKEVDVLHPDQKEDDRKTLEIITALTDEFKELNDDVKAYLEKAAPPGK
jgi:hypothetical protein